MEGDFLTFWQPCSFNAREQGAGRAVSLVSKSSFRVHAVKYLQEKDLNESVTSVFMLGMEPLSFL